MSDFRQDEFFMRQALRQAAMAVEAGEVPVGAIVVRAQIVIGRAYNQVEMLKDPTVGPIGFPAWRELARCRCL